MHHQTCPIFFLKCPILLILVSLSFGAQIKLPNICMFRNPLPQLFSFQNIITHVFAVENSVKKCAQKIVVWKIGPKKLKCEKLCPKNGSVKNCDTFVSLKRGTLHFVCLSRDNAVILFDTALNDPYLVMVSNPADLSRLFFLCVSFSNWAMPSMRARFSASHCSNRQY